MKFLPLLLLVLLTHIESVHAQAGNALAFDYGKAEAAIMQGLLQNDNWTAAVDNEQGIDQFKSRRDVVKNARIKAIAVFQLDKEKFMTFAFGEDISNFYKSASRYRSHRGFLTKNGRGINILFAPRTDAHEGLSGGSFCMSAEGAEILYEAYKQHPQEFSFDVTFQTYAFFNGPAITFWSSKQKRFIEFKEIVKSEAALTAMKQCLNPLKAELLDDDGCDFGNFFANGKPILGR